MNRRVLGILGVGVLLSPTFPAEGFRSLLTKIFERVLFALQLNPVMAVIISGTIGLLLAIYIFKFCLQYFANYIEANPDDLSNVFKKALIVFISFQLTWIIIPLVDGALGSNFSSIMKSSYETVNESVYYEFLTAPFWVAGTISGIVMIYRYRYLMR